MGFVPHSRVDPTQDVEVAAEIDDVVLGMAEIHVMRVEADGDDVHLLRGGIEQRHFLAFATRIGKIGGKLVHGAVGAPVVGFALALAHRHPDSPLIIHHGIMDHRARPMRNRRDDARNVDLGCDAAGGVECFEMPDMQVGAVDRPIGIYARITLIGRRFIMDEVTAGEIPLRDDDIALDALGAGRGRRDGAAGDPVGPVRVHF